MSEQTRPPVSEIMPDVVDRLKRLPPNVLDSREGADQILILRTEKYRLKIELAEAKEKIARLVSRTPGRFYLDGCAKLRVLHILRNPHGFTEDQVRQARVDGADMIEMIDGRYEDRAHPGCGDTECVKQNRCLRAFEPRCPSCGCLRDHMPCDTNGAITGCWDEFHKQVGEGGAVNQRAREMYEVHCARAGLEPKDWNTLDSHLRGVWELRAADARESFDRWWDSWVGSDGLPSMGLHKRHARAAWDAGVEAAAKHCEAMGNESSRAYAAYDQCAESMRLLLKTLPPKITD